MTQTLTPTLFQQQLLRWYQQAGRHALPWREDISPYRVWLSEIMLQQTQVATVIPYFHRFLSEFPSVADLARADLNHVLHLWSGLGYYSRAKNLHACAQQLHEKHHDQFPDQLDELILLPGIGRSTAGAILALAFDQRVPILDGNVKRTLTRLFGIAGYPEQSAIKNQLWDLAEKLLPEQRVHDYTQALMDFGATLCTPRNPQCTNCPMQKQCQAYATDQVHLLPTPKPRTKLPLREVYWLVLMDPQQRVLLHQRPATGIWSHLWCLPEIALDAESTTYLAEQYGLQLDKPQPHPAFTHTFTHFKLRVTPLIYAVDCAFKHTLQDPKLCWYDAQNPQKIGLATPARVLLSQLTENNAHV